MWFSRCHQTCYRKIGGQHVFLSWLFPCIYICKFLCYFMSLIYRNQQVIMSHSFLERFFCWFLHGAQLFNAHRSRADSLSDVLSSPFFCWLASTQQGKIHTNQWQASPQKETPCSTCILSLLWSYLSVTRCDRLSQDSVQVRQLCGAWSISIRWRKEENIIRCFSS